MSRALALLSRIAINSGRYLNASSGLECSELRVLWLAIQLNGETGGLTLASRGSEITNANP
jgi:hypothetical protein